MIQALRAVDARCVNLMLLSWAGAKIYQPMPTNRHHICPIALVGLAVNLDEDSSSCSRDRVRYPGNYALYGKGGLRPCGNQEGVTCFARLAACN